MNDQAGKDNKSSELLDELSNPSKPLVYSSPLIHERRHRILKETRNIIAEKGIEGFNVRDLCRRADIAQRTLYNAFHSKERVIAIAIRQSYDNMVEHLVYKTSPGTLDGLLDRRITTNRRNFSFKNYTRAVASVYFSSQAHQDIWQALHDMSLINLRKWIDRLAADGLIEPWIIVDDFANLMANLEYTTINDWAQDRISDDAYIRRLVEGTLMLAVGAVKDPVRAQAIKYLNDIKERGALPSFPPAVWRVKANSR